MRHWARRRRSLPAGTVVEYSSAARSTPMSVQSFSGNLLKRAAPSAEFTKVNVRSEMVEKPCAKSHSCALSGTWSSAIIAVKSALLSMDDMARGKEQSRKLRKDEFPKKIWMQTRTSWKSTWSAGLDQVSRKICLCGKMVLEARHSNQHGFQAVLKNHHSGNDWSVCENGSHTTTSPLKKEKEKPEGRADWTTQRCCRLNTAVLT